MMSEVKAYTLNKKKLEDGAKREGLKTKSQIITQTCCCIANGENVWHKEKNKQSI